MPRVFFTSDTHFGHDAIRHYCKRPYGSVENMDAELIARWNYVVTDEDIVYHLGDFCFAEPAGAERYFSQLNGLIRLVPGNHDRWLRKAPNRQYLSASKKPLEVLPELVTQRFQMAGGLKPIVLCHYPLREWDGYYHEAWHLFGHCHGNRTPGVGSLDVGVDCFPSPLELSQLGGLIKASPES